MSKYAQQQRRPQSSQGEQQQPQHRADLLDPGLDEDVACCLAEIDEVLDREADEREQARREFDAFGKDTTNRELNLWQAKWAHLGLKYGRSCCGTPFMYEEKN